MQISLRNPTASLDEPIRHSRLAMVDMGDNAEVSNVFHGICFSRKQREGAGGAGKLYGNALRTGVEFPVKKYSTRLKKIITRAGLKPWPKLFQNMRATRQTELSAQFPLHVVCAWLGNSAPIAQKHYLQVTEQHFAEAIGGGAKSGAAPTRHLLAPVPPETKAARKNRAALPIGAIPSELLQSHPVPRRGVEPLSPP